MLAKIKYRLFLLKKLFLIDSNEKTFLQFATEKWGARAQAQEDNGELLIDAVAHNPYIFQTAYLANLFSSRYGLRIKTVLPVIDTRIALLYKYFYSYTVIRKLYHAFGCQDGLDYLSPAAEVLKKSTREAKSIIGSLRSKDELGEIRVDGVRIGDLIYDTYLRTHACPTVDLRDRRLLRVIRSALIIYYTCKDYLDTHDVKKVALIHAVYIEHGILARLALERGIDVFICNCLESQFIHKLSPGSFSQERNHSLYRIKFASLDNKETRLAQARSVLTQRLSGVIDTGTSYMRSSAYSAPESKKNVLKKTGRPRVLIMLHCFFDSPHVFEDMIFPDFYEWLHFTLSVAEQTDFDFYVKPHPNGLPGNDEIISDFQKRYKTVTFIDKSISNRQLVAEGVDAVITVWGTLGHEFPYLGIPVITAGDNPHSKYSFCSHATTKAEYEHLLRNADRLPKDVSRSEIEEFFYMHYLYIGDGRLQEDNDPFHFSATFGGKEDQNSMLLKDLVMRAKSGEFDKVPLLFDEALGQFER